MAGGSRAQPAVDGSAEAAPTLLSLADICEKYCVSDRWVRGLVRKHSVPVLRMGRAFLFDARTETAFLEATRMFQDQPGSRGRVRDVAPRSARGDYERALALAAAPPQVKTLPT